MVFTKFEVDIMLARDAIFSHGLIVIFITGRRGLEPQLVGDRFCRYPHLIGTTFKPIRDVVDNHCLVRPSVVGCHDLGLQAIRDSLRKDLGSIDTIFEFIGAVVCGCRRVTFFVADHLALGLSLFAIVFVGVWVRVIVCVLVGVVSFLELVFIVNVWKLRNHCCNWFTCFGCNI